jgi:hypothetical protein
MDCEKCEHEFKEKEVLDIEFPVHLGTFSPFVDNNGIGLSGKYALHVIDLCNKAGELEKENAEYFKQVLRLQESNTDLQKENHLLKQSEETSKLQIEQSQKEFNFLSKANSSLQFDKDELINQLSAQKHPEPEMWICPKAESCEHKGISDRHCKPHEYLSSCVKTSSTCPACVPVVKKDVLTELREWLLGYRNATCKAISICDVLSKILELEGRGK